MTPTDLREVQDTTLQLGREHRILLQNRVCKIQPLAAVLCVRHLAGASYPRHRPVQAVQERHWQNQHWQLACRCIRSISFGDTTAIIRMRLQKSNCTSTRGDLQVGRYVLVVTSCRLATVTMNRSTATLNLAARATSPSHEHKAVQSIGSV